MSATYDKSVGFRFVFPESPQPKAMTKEVFQFYENLTRIRNTENRMNEIEAKIVKARKHK